MQTILVTGGAGFIGSNLVEALLRRRTIEKVICVDNLDPFYEPAFKKQNIKPFLANEKFRFYKTDIRNHPSLEKIFKNEQPTFVIHLAAKTDTRRAVKEPEEYESVNIAGTLNILELSREYKIKKFIFISSSSVYGNSAVPPFSESDVTDFPLSPYGATKKAGEIIAYTYFYNFGLSITCLRLFNVYGERNRPDLVIYKWVENILRNRPIEMSGIGKRRRDFTYIGDVVRAILLALKKGKGYEIINIGNSKPVLLATLLKYIEKSIGKRAMVIHRPSNRASVELTCADIRKAKKILGWEPKVGLEKGLSKFITWFRNSRFKNTV